MIRRLSTIALLAISLPAFAISKSGHLSVIVDGYIDLPNIADVNFPEINTSNVNSDQTATQNYNIITDYAASSSTPNVQVIATSVHTDSQGAFMTDNPSSPGADQKLYFTLKYHSCGSAGADYPLVQYNTPTLFPTENIPNAQAISTACSVANGTLTFTRVAVPTGNPYPSAGLYLGTITLTAQAIGG